MHAQEDEADWEVTSSGLYVATRGFLIRRGYCCANRCRNCPYINWRQWGEWQPIPAERVRRARVTPKAIAGAEEMLGYHERQFQQGKGAERAYHQRMIEHYQHLLVCWGKGSST